MNCSINTIKLFNFEEELENNDDYPKGHTKGRHSFPISTENLVFKIDPTSQYAIGLIYSSQLVIIPLIIEQNSKSPIRIIDLYDDLHMPGTVVDFSFLYGFDYPTLAILQVLFKI